MEHAQLQLENVSAFYGGMQALHGVDMQLQAGEIVALMGPNGAGKSTVLKTTFGLLEHASGQIFLNGQKLKPVPHQMVGMGIAFVPQGRRVFTHLTIQENLEMGGFVVKDTKELKRRINEVFEFFPALRAKRNAKSATLSGGQQQMLAIARALVTEPKILLLDEPSLGLAPKIVKEVFAKIKEINRSQKTTIVVVEHNIKSLLEIVDRAYVLDKGKVIAQGKAEELVKSGILQKVFLGLLE